jgi:uncharacterized repeat protein (TIGR01451 family)
MNARLRDNLPAAGARPAAPDNLLGNLFVRALLCAVCALGFSAAAAPAARAQADLVVTKSGPASAAPGENIIYTITLTNAGASDAHDVVLTDKVPDNTTAFGFQQDEESGGTPAYQISSNGSTFTASAPLVQPGDSATFVMGVTVNPGTPAGTIITNTASAASSDPDANPDDNSATVNTTVTGSSADLLVVKSGPSDAAAGDTITYSITVTNGGPSPAQNVTLKDQPPPGTTPQSFTQTSGPEFSVGSDGQGAYTAQIASLAPNESADFELVVQINRSVPDGAQLSNSANVSSSTPDPDSSNNTSTATTAVSNTQHVAISEFRFRGPNGALDEFVEIYNDSNSPLTVLASDNTGGWAVVAASDSAPRCAIPDNTIIPSRGHFLCVNSAGYSLNGYPAGTSVNAVGDATYTADIPDGDGVGLFTSEQNFTAATLLDAVGFSSVTNPLFREGTGLALPVTTNSEFSFFRRMESGPPQDTNDNAADFQLAATDPGTVGNGSQLGAPGPENTFSPTGRNKIKPALIEPTAPSSDPPNRVRDSTPVANGSHGTLSFRRRFVNNTGATVTRLRFRVVNITTLGTPISVSPQADLRLLSSGSFPITTTLGSLTVQGTTLEQPPAQPLGGGVNSSATVPLPGGGLAPGASIDVQFLLGVQQTGNFRFFIVIEALTNPTTDAPQAQPAEETKRLNVGVKSRGGKVRN